MEMVKVDRGSSIRFRMRSEVELMKRETVACPYEYETMPCVCVCGKLE